MWYIAAVQVRYSGGMGGLGGGGGSRVGGSTGGGSVGSGGSGLSGGSFVGGWGTGLAVAVVVAVGVRDRVGSGTSVSPGSTVAVACARDVVTTFTVTIPGATGSTAADPSSRLEGAPSPLDRAVGPVSGDWTPAPSSALAVSVASGIERLRLPPPGVPSVTLTSGSLLGAASSP